MITINKSKRDTNNIRIRELLQKDGFLHDRNNKIFNRTYKKEYEMTMNSYVQRNISTDSIID